MSNLDIARAYINAVQTGDQVALGKVGGREHLQALQAPLGELDLGRIILAAGLQSGLPRHESGIHVLGAVDGDAPVMGQGRRRTPSLRSVMRIPRVAFAPRVWIDQDECQ